MGIWGARVLVVDEDVETVETVGRLLGAGGADVINVASAGAALATVIGVIPDVIVVDTTTPGLDATGLLRAIRALSPEKGGQVPAIILVAEDGREASWPAAFQAHLTKPFDPLDLFVLVQRLAGIAVERRERTLDRRHWPRDVSRDRRAEVRDVPPSSSETGYF